MDFFAISFGDICAKITLVIAELKFFELKIAELKIAEYIKSLCSFELKITKIYDLSRGRGKKMKFVSD